MAFQVVDVRQRRWAAPPSLDGHYLLPYAWLKYGLEFGFLEIEDKAFYDTLQGSLYLQLCDENQPMYYQSSKREHDVWFQFTAGESSAYPVLSDPKAKDGYSIISGSYLKQDVHFVNLNDLHDLSPSQQKTVNNSIIQLMKGCHVKLKFSVWF